MKTNKEAAAVALANAVEDALIDPQDWCHWPKYRRLRDAYEHYRALRATPPPPAAVGELESGVVEAAMTATELILGKGDMLHSKGHVGAALIAACAALRRARQPEPLRQALDAIDTPNGDDPRETIRVVRIFLTQAIDAALAQKGGGRV